MGTDDRLAQRYASGADGAFEELFAEFRGPVIGVAMQVLPDRGLAEEAAQLAFVSVWRSRARYDPARSLAAWVFGIARKSAIDIYRRERRGPVPLEVAEDTTTEDPPFDRLWEAWEVRRAVDRLPPEEAEVVRMTHFHQMTHREVADRLNVAIGTVKSRSHRAHRRLAEWLEHLTAATVDPTPAGEDR